MNYQSWNEALEIISGEDDSYALEGCSISGLGPPHPIASEEFISTDHFSPQSIGIKSDIVTIPNLGWPRLDVSEVFWYYCYFCWI